MPKMTKQQREVLYKATQKKLVTALNTKHKVLLQRHCKQVKVVYGDTFGLHDIAKASTTFIAALHDIHTTLIKAGQITVSVNSDSQLKIHKSSVAENTIRVFHDELDVVQRDIDKINTMMAEEFLLKTSFTDIDNIHEFMQEFTNRFK